MGKAKQYNITTASCSIGIDPITGTPKIYAANGKEATAFQTLGYMFVAGAHFLRGLFIGSNNEEMSAEEFAKYLENTQLEVKQNELGYYYLAAGDKAIPPYNPFALNCEAPSPTKPQVTVERKHGNTIYNVHIHNLTINITADVITQLNLNPEKVENIYQDKLIEEIDKIIKTEIASKIDTMIP